MAKIRLADVAAHAGVSVATASAVARGVVDGPNRVGQATRLRVERAIEDLGYRPNAAARALRTRRTAMVGLVVPDLTNPLFPQVVRAAQLRAEQEGLVLATWDTGYSRDRELAALDAILDRQFDGAILVTEHVTAADVQVAVDAGLAVASTDRRLAIAEVDLVSEDLEAGARTATEHLIELGHRRIGHISGGPENTVGAARLGGYREAIRAAGAEVDADLVFHGDFDRETGCKGAEALLDLTDPPTAVLAANDAIALGILHACAARDLAVPDRLAVLGIDNTPEAEAFRPALTTMDVRPAAVGTKLMDAVIARRDSTTPPESRREVVVPVLVRRDTT